MDDYFGMRALLRGFVCVAVALGLTWAVLLGRCALDCAGKRIELHVPVTLHDEEPKP